MQYMTIAEICKLYPNKVIKIHDCTKDADGNITGGYIVEVEDNQPPEFDKIFGDLFVEQEREPPARVAPYRIQIACTKPRKPHSASYVYRPQRRQNRGE